MSALVLALGTLGPLGASLLVFAAVLLAGRGVSRMWARQRVRALRRAVASAAPDEGSPDRT